MWKRLMDTTCGSFHLVDLEKIQEMLTRIVSIRRLSTKLCPVKVFEFTREIFSLETRLNYLFSDSIVFIIARTNETCDHTRKRTFDDRIIHVSCFSNTHTNFVTLNLCYVQKIMFITCIIYF